MNSFHSLLFSAGCSFKRKKDREGRPQITFSTEPHCQRDHPLPKCIYSITTELTNSASL
uniref:Uncharacterized protein n=1 Tax=Anguilla anguilla TaxID=7936 RepID=A0A0E9PGX1_ANGAN